ncbi:MAG: S41 family peptidase [Turicibacter sp.]|nr:S41 family peptidase [Turicibacter sp.]
MMKVNRAKTRPKLRKSPKPPRGRGYNFFRFGFFILLALLVGGIYATYDYWVLRMLISQHYVFEEDLDRLYIEALGEDNFRSHFRDFDRMMAAVLTREIRNINQDRFTYLYNPGQFMAARQQERQIAQTVRFEALTDNIVYLALPNIHSYARRFVWQNREELAQFSYLILDLRGNFGGMLRDFHQIADLFVAPDATIAYERTRWSLFTRTIRGNGDPYFNFDKLLILQNAATASAAEGLVLALRENVPNITTIGTTTFGKAIGQVSIPMRGGSAVRATVLVLEGPAGEWIHNIGIEPDIEYEGDALAMALALLQ